MNKIILHKYNGQKLCTVISKLIFPLFSLAYLSNAQDLASVLSYIYGNITKRF